MNICTKGLNAHQGVTCSPVPFVTWVYGVQFAGSPGDDLQRMEACLTRRFVLVNCSWVEGLNRLSATCQSDWDDVTLSGLLYKF